MLGQTERAFWGYEATVECWPGPVGLHQRPRSRVAWPFHVHADASRAIRNRLYTAATKEACIYTPLASATTCAAQTADGLHSAEGLLDPLANLLTDLVAWMTHVRTSIAESPARARLRAMCGVTVRAEVPRPPAKRSPAAPSGHSHSLPQRLVLTEASAQTLV
jgi:hypothetical protein